MCHAATPSHESFREAPKNVTLETIAEIKKHAATVYTQTVQTKAMPLGNQTAMTDDERSCARSMAQGAAVSGDVKPWGIFATFALGAIALLVGQLSGIVGGQRAYTASI